MAMIYPSCKPLVYASSEALSDASSTIDPAFRAPNGAGPASWGLSATRGEPGARAL